jgi:hypothetical protein
MIFTPEFALYSRLKTPHGRFPLFFISFAFIRAKPPVRHIVQRFALILSLQSL